MEKQVPTEAEASITPCLTGEAARLLEMSERSVRSWADAGRLDVWRTSRGLRVFNREQLVRVAAQRAAKK